MGDGKHLAGKVSQVTFLMVKYMLNATNIINNRVGGKLIMSKS